MIGTVASAAVAVEVKAAVPVPPLIAWEVAAKDAGRFEPASEDDFLGVISWDSEVVAFNGMWELLHEFRRRGAHDARKLYARAFAALAVPGDEFWRAVADSAHELLVEYDRQADGKRGRTSGRAYAWRAWRIRHVYTGATVPRMAAVEGISRRAVQKIRAAGAA
jgi:hypothetical protein